MKVVFTPLVNNVVLRLEPTPRLSELIHQPDSTKEGLCRFGEVLAVGPEVKDVRVGQRVLASVTAAVQLGKDNDHLVREDAIMAIRHE